jgi:hypothetical protein
LRVMGGKWSPIASRMKSLRRLGLVCGVVALGVLSPRYAIPRRPALDALPRLVLWAWERPEDLRQIDDDIGVAFLAQTITVSGERLTLHPRLQPLRVPMANQPSNDGCFSPAKPAYWERVLVSQTRS